MPLSKHFGGHGKEVMASMRRTYGDEETAKRVFYATENKDKKAARKRAQLRAVRRA
jgi:hypothetical protein